MGSVHDYEIVTRYFDGEWKEERQLVKGVSYEAAGRVMIHQAALMDAKYGDSATWRVDLYNPDKPEYGSYYQLFHGRTS